MTDVETIREMLAVVRSESDDHARAVRELAQALALCDIADVLNRIADVMSQTQPGPARSPLVGVCGHGKMAAEGGTSWRGWTGSSPLPWAHVRLGEGPLDFCDQPPAVER